MAVIQHTTENIVGATQRITWESLGVAAANDTGSPVFAPDHAFKEVQVIATYDGATVTIEGSLDGGTTWATLNDVQGNALTYTTGSRIEKVQETCAMIRPAISSVGANTDVKVILVQKMDTTLS